MTAVSDRQRRPEVVSRHLLLFSSHRLPVPVDRFRTPRATSPAGPAERTSFAVTRTERSWNCQGERPFLIQEFICVLKNFGQVQVSNLLPPDECTWGRSFKNLSCNFIKRVLKSLASQEMKKIIVFTNTAKLLWTLFIKLQLWCLKDRPLMPTSWCLRADAYELMPTSWCLQADVAPVYATIFTWTLPNNCLRWNFNLSNCRMLMLLSWLEPSPGRKEWRERTSWPRTSRSSRQVGSAQMF